MNGMPITMLNGVGCPGCGGTCNTLSLSGLGATRSEIEEFFIGKNKYVKNTKPTSVYKNPGEAPFKTISPNNTIGRVVELNSKANWGKLDDGNWISLAPGTIDSYFTVILTTPPPKSIIDAVTREIDNIPFLPSAATIKLIAGAVIVVGVVILVMKFKPSQKAAA